MFENFIRTMHYYYPINLTTRIKMNCNKKDQLNVNQNLVGHRQSDFSIDYLLNRAGSDTCRSATECYSCSGNNEKKSEPQLDWLHYTRYHPPKIQRM